ncbi:MAG: SUMF1/EgtB/PvdO family nonheme iron enzyme [bacterium]
MLRACTKLYPLLVTLTVLGAGCGDNERGATDAGADSSAPDAAPDGAPQDARPADAATDGGADTDAAVACSVGGQDGVCIDVAECDGVSTPGYCPGPANIQCCTPATSTCDAADEPQPNVGLTEAPGGGGCPDGMIPVDTFCIDRYEAALLLVHPDETTEPWSPFHNPGTERVRAVSLAGAVPQGYISGDQAAAACAEAGKRLCTDQQWLRACQGPGATTYPYGDTLLLGTCNDHRAVHPAVEYFGTSDPWIWSELGHPCINQLPDSLDLTGQNAGCVTAEGVFDMMGNLHEWTADPNGTFRGGFYVDTSINGPGCLYATTAHNIYHWDYSTGFRCCAD